MNYKALLVGISVIVFTGLLMQLFFLLGATGYTLVIRQHPEWQTLGLFVSYILGGLAFFITMASGAYICADMARKNIYLHSLIIAVFTTGLSLLLSLQGEGLTINSLIFIFMGVIFSLAGARLWLYHQQ